MSKFKSPKDCREPEYQEFALSRWKNMSDEKRRILLDLKKQHVNDNLLQMPDNTKENFYRQMWGMPLVEGEEFPLFDPVQNLVKKIEDRVKELDEETK